MLRRLCRIQRNSLGRYSQHVDGRGVDAVGDLHCRGPVHEGEHSCEFTLHGCA
jgi:hypothetical protein